MFNFPGLILTVTFLCFKANSCKSDCCNLSYHYLEVNPRDETYNNLPIRLDGIPKKYTMKEET